LILSDLTITGGVWIRPKYYSASNPIGFRIPGLQATLRNIDLKEFTAWKSSGVSLENIVMDNNINGVGLGTDAQEVSGIAYLYLNNVEVLEAKSHCVYLAGGGDNILIENSKFHHCGIYESQGGDLRDGITVHGMADNLIIRNNEIYNNGYALGLDSAYDKGTPPEYIRNVIFENNKIYNQESYVFQLRSIQNSIFRNNLIYNNPGIVFGIYGPKIDDGQLDELTNNLEIYHNTIYNNPNGVIFYLGEYNTPNHNEMISNIYFKNNIAVSSSGRVLTNYLPSSNSVFMSNNIYSGVLTKPALDINSQNIDPLLVNPTGANFQLQNNSPAIDYGVSVNAKYDYAGVLRNSLPDAGAYENLSAPPPPPPACQENWTCGSWSACAASSTQTRACADSNTCGTVLNKPAENQSCVYMPSCTPIWSCGAWSICSNNLQTRTCTDSKNCGTTSGKPVESQGCSVLPPTPPPAPGCAPNWSCSAWSLCNSSKIQIRTCNDTKNCNTLLNKPIESQSCGTACSSKWSCSNWSSCHASGYKVRTCTDSNACGSTAGILNQSYSCSPPQSDVLYTTKYKYENNFQGRLVKLTDDSAVYVVDSQNQRHLFVNAPTFWTWYN